jgi:histidinol-phosphate aminotransferase
MSPTPVTMTSPTAPVGYSWEATSEQVAARYGVAVEEVLRFDLNTAATAPDIALAALASGPFEGGLSEYPPSDYRRLVAAAAARYGVGPEELLVGAGADEILDLIGKAFLSPGAAAVVPAPTYAMFRVVSEQRRARVIVVPRLGAERGFALDADAVRAAGRKAAVIWLCSPNNPTALPEPSGSIAALLDGLAQDAASAGRTPPVVALDEAYAEFTGTSLLDLRSRYPRLVVIRTASKAYGLAGLRVGFAVARRELLAEIEPYRPPGSLSVVSVAVATAAFESDGWLGPRVAAVHAERDRLAAGLSGAGWTVYPSVTNFLLVRFASPAEAAGVAEALLRRGIVPRTFGADHPLADHLRITVRSEAQDDRFLWAAAAIGRSLDPAADPVVDPALGASPRAGAAR